MLGICATLILPTLLAVLAPMLGVLGWLVSDALPAPPSFPLRRKHWR